MRRLLLLAAVLLAGCGGGARQSQPTVKAPPPLAERCGATHVASRTFWFDAADGTRLDGAELGKGPRGVILLHESPADLCGWEPYGETLAQRGFHVLLVDLRGFGLSRRGRYGGSRGAIADVRGAVDELRRIGAKRVDLVGASYGAVNALVASPSLGSKVSGVGSLSGELDLASSGLNALAAVPKLRAPLLVMGSRQDPYLDEADARRLLRATGSKQKSLVEFDGSLHGWDLLSASGPQRRRADSSLVGFLERTTQ